ncbi:MAG: response regulator [Candidatus Woesearchaeota archaeon]
MAKILIVEDEEQIRKIYKRELKEYSILEAKDGREGLELALSYLPDVIVTDRNMPNLNGHKMVKALKERPETSQIPIIGSGGFSADEQLALDVYIPKEGWESFRKIYTTIKELLGRDS